MHCERAVSMMLTKREGGSKVTPSLSASSGGRRSGRRERASGPANSFPGTWIILRSKSATGFDDHSEVFNLISGEFAFFKLQMKV